MIIVRRIPDYLTYHTRIFLVVKSTKIHHVLADLYHDHAAKMVIMKARGLNTAE